MRRATAILAACVLAAAAATTASGAPAAIPGCAKSSLRLIEPEVLTIATDNPAYPPWFDGGAPRGSKWKLNDPSNGRGFESAVANAVARELGFAKSRVEWKALPFTQSFRPGKKPFDFYIAQVSYSPARAKAVTFSSSYYNVNQAVVALRDNDIANARRIAQLRDAKLGTQVATTSYDYIVDRVKPSEQPNVYDTLDAAVAALKARQIDGLVVDLPTAFFVTAVQVDGGKIVGQFPSVPGGEHFGLVLEKGNPLVRCVNAALARLKRSGRLAAIQRTWLSTKTRAPVLR